jgi:hypothetical protein
MAIIKMFDAQYNNQHVPVEKILATFPDALPDLKILLETGFIQPYASESYNPEVDLMVQLQPGPRLTVKGAELLLRSRFLF